METNFLTSVATIKIDHKLKDGMVLINQANAVQNVCKTKIVKVLTLSILFLYVIAKEIVEYMNVAIELRIVQKISLLVKKTM